MMPGSGESDSRVSLSVRVPADLRRRLRVYAAEHEISAQECVQAALSSWLGEHEGREISDVK